MNSLIGGEILLTDENVAPAMPMPDAPETGLGTEPADQPFEMDMSNISSSLMRDVEFSSGAEKMTWELMQSVVERGSSSKRPVDRRGMDILIAGEPELVEEPRAPVNV
ncbi:hypothetical protein OIU84_028048 [Salix udensis]|uniref:Uncharacterized protein n=1 Tax=Salix udensis TaxID=889485 RepID=A0AAD6KBZ0_9ROSI|nr:hypothetical protein OIU84_028048 [Salix udensis]